MKNLPNILSILRLILSLVAFSLVVSYQEWFAAFILLAVALASDWLDGWLARRYRWESELGRKLDKVGDTVFFPSILAGVALTHQGLFWPAVILLLSALIGKILRATKRVPKEIRFLLNVTITSCYVILSLAVGMVYMYEAFGLSHKPFWVELGAWGVLAVICFGALRYNYPRVLMWVNQCQKIIEGESSPDA
ncbi:MAG: CDP-alcohol phosphatidyltransferase family protein [bacterium]